MGLTPEEKPYRPIFAGESPDGYVVLYRYGNDEEDLYLLRPDGTFWALSPMSEVNMMFDVSDDLIYIAVKSPEWTGTAVGTKQDLVEASALGKDKPGKEAQAISQARILGPVCPHCGEPAPHGDARLPWLATHTDSRFHRWWWNIKRFIGGG
jgi:hypothetical protein